MYNYKKRRHFIIDKKFLLIIIFIASIFLGIGYAQVSDVNLHINGSATAQAEEAILITSVVYDSNNNANPSESVINDTYLTLMNSTITLGNTLSSSITYQVTIKNNTSAPAYYDDAIYDPGIGYDNNDIEFVVNGIQNGDILNAGQSKTITITFKYKDSLSQITNNVLNSYIDFKFDESNYVAKIGNNYYQTLSAAVSAVPTDDTLTTIELLKNTSEVINIVAHKNIILDLKSHTLTNDGDANVIKNYGTLTIKNGTVISNTPSNGALDNNSPGTMNINNVHVEMNATGGKQAVYNNKGTVTIDGDSYIFSKGSQRAAVQNVSGGTLNIKSATIIATFNSAVNNAGTMTIGTKDNDPDVTSVVIQGSVYGVTSTTNYNFYDGIIKGVNNSVNNFSKIVDIESGYSIAQSEEVIDNNTYKTAFLGITHTVTFNPNGGSVSETTRNIVHGSKINTLPTPSNPGYRFDGWFTELEGGTQINANTIINEDKTFFAHWTMTIAAEVNGVTYNTIQAAINSVPSNGEETTVIVLRDVSENVTVAAGKNIELDLQNYTFSNSNTNAIIENNGTLKIKNGNITSNGETSLINNNNGGRLIISGGRLTSTGTRQVVYNNAGGIVEISGDAYLSSTASGNPTSNQVTLGRATVQNLKNGIINIYGGTIIGINQQAISNEGTMNIGTKDGTISTTTPLIRGETYGIVSNSTLNYYDGNTMGIVGAISGTVNDIESNSQFVDGSEVVNNKTYLSKHLETN